MNDRDEHTINDKLNIDISLAGSFIYTFDFTYDNTKYNISIDLILEATEEQLILICIDWKGKLNDLFNECINKIN